MSFSDRWRRFAPASIAFAFEREQAWSVEPFDQTASATATCVATESTRRRVVAIGDDAVKLRSQVSEQLIITDYIREGGIETFDVAEAAIRVELRRRVAGMWRLPPRVLVATRQNEMAKRAMRDVMIHAGARDVVTIPNLMAGAIGAGIDVSSVRPSIVFMLDRDWAGVGLVQSNNLRVSDEVAGGVDQMLEDVAARARERGGVVPGSDVLRTRLKTRGLTGSDVDAGHGWFVRRWYERFLQATHRLPATERLEISRASLCLIGPYANTPGLLELFSTIWERTTISSGDPERAVIHGCQKVLGELGDLIKSAK